MNLQSKMLWWKNFSFNPVMVKELRQFVRGRFMFYIIILFMAIPLFSIGVPLITESYHENVVVGRTLFYGLLSALGFACNLFVPAYIGIRLAREYASVNTDLLFITALTPGMIVRGKLYTGIIMTLLLFSVSMPFMTLTYLLRGIDLLNIFASLAFIFLLSVVFTQFAILLGAFPLNKFFKMVVVIVLLYGILAFGGMFIYGGLTRITGGMLGTVSFYMLIVFTMSYVFSVAIFMPVSSNRSFPVRVTLTVLWLISGVLSIILESLKKGGNPLMTWSVSSIAVAALFLPVAVSEPGILSARIRRAIPENRFLRILAFPLFTCSAGGVIWSVLVALVTVAAVFLAGLYNNFIMQDVINKVIVLFLYATAYSSTGVLVQRYIFREKAPYLTWIITLILIAAGAIVPTLIGFFIKNITIDSESLGLWQMGNITAVFWQSDYLYAHLLVASLWACAGILLNMRWFFRQIREFRPFHETRLPQISH